MLYWHGPTNSTDLTVNATVDFGGQSVTGTNVGGLANENCWGFQNSQAYKADVSHLVTGNGSYALGNFTKPNADVNGAQLLVFFNDGNPTNNRDVIVFSGNDSNQYFAGPPLDPAGWDGTFSIPNYANGTAWMHMVVSDGQDTGSDGDLSVGSWTTAGVQFNGATVPLGNGNDLRGSLWDYVRYDVTSVLAPGANTLPYSLTNSFNDCISLIATAFDVPAGAVAPLPTLTLGNPGTLPANTAPSYSGTVQNPGAIGTVDLVVTGPSGYNEAIQTAVLPGNTYVTPGAALPPGTYTVTATLTGTAATQTQTFVVQAAPVLTPALTLDNPGTLPASTAPNYQGTVQNPGGATTVDLLVTGPSGYSETLQANITAGNSYSIAGAALPPGTYSLTATITGTSATQTVAFVVQGVAVSTVNPVPTLGEAAFFLLSAAIAALGLRRKRN